MSPIMLIDFHAFPSVALLLLLFSFIFHHTRRRNFAYSTQGRDLRARPFAIAFQIATWPSLEKILCLGLESGPSAMPPAGERCYGCNRLAPPALRNLAPGGRRRCDRCDRLTARWQVCDLAGCALRRIPQQPARCEPVVALPHPRRASGLVGAAGYYACFACFFAN